MDLFANGFSLELFLTILRRHIWIAIALFCVIFTAGVSLLLFLPNLYTAKAVLLVEGQSIPAEFVRQTVTMGVERRLQSISQDLLSRSRLEKLAEEFELYGDLKQKGASGDVIAGAMRLDINIRNAPRVGIVGGSGGGTMAFEVGYTSPNPEKAMQVANKLASDYIEENTKIREQLSLGTSAFLRQQLDEAKQRLEKHEQQVMFYKRQHLGELPEQLDANLRTLDVLQKQMGTISDNLARAREHYNLLLMQMQRANADVALSPTDTPTLRGKSTQGFVSLPAQLAELKVRFSDKHPDVIRMKKLIAALAEEEKNQTQHDPSDLVPSTSLQKVSPAQLEQAEVSTEIQRLAADLGKVNQELVTYKQRIENTAKREQELFTITRDYESTRDLYKSLLKRYEEASMADDMEKEQRSERFRLIERAVYPQEPSAPQRPRFFLLTLALSLGAAVGGVFLREIQNTSFHRVEDLKKFVKIPVLVSITRIVTDRDRYSRHFYNGLGVVALLMFLILLVNVSYYVANGNEQLVRLFGARS
jgi:polysaccharide chain length determinant protein (PEP-CTERM system associated)